MDPCNPPPHENAPVIETRKQLVSAMQDASELEHLLMICYLHAALTLKKANEPGITPAEAEVVRRWEAKTLMIARQEMEHLGLVNNLLIGMGEAPYLYRPDFPLMSDFFDHLDLPFRLERYNKRAVRRFVKFEKPDDPYLEGLGYDLSELEPKKLEPVLTGGPEEPLQLLRARSLNQGIDFKSIQELYRAIQVAINNCNGFEELNNLFRGSASREPYQDFQFNFEMNIFTFPVTDARTANAAINLILKQGEGIDSQPGYSSHFHIFSEILEEFKAANRDNAAFEPAWNVVLNPSKENVTDPFALDAMDFFNDSYTTMVYMLLGFYAYFSPESCDQSFMNISTALQETAFAPMMTMIVRPLGEIITRRPSGEGPFYAGPNWDLVPDKDQPLPDGESLLRLPPEKDLPDFFINRLGLMERQGYRLKELAAELKLPADVQKRLEFMCENITRMDANFQRIITS
ncbi:MAG TPA: ferritin-like domain-containing protein [Blastocatellia bacterium]|nr:ferritin-like domain-containing protein [Blastocatellia bacterium]